MFTKEWEIKNLIIVLILTISFSGRAQEPDNKQDLSETSSYKVESILKPISIGGAIQQGIEQNHDQINRDYLKDIIEINWKDTWSSFWLPNIDLSLSINTHRLSQLRRTSSLIGSQPRNTGGSISLNMGQYSLFNWGKDYLSYLNSKQTYRRQKQVLTEQKRELKFRIVESYSDLLTSRDRLRSYKKFLRHSSYAYRMAKEKVQAKKLSLQNYYMIRTLYLKAYEQYTIEKRQYQSQSENLAFILDDEVNTRYSTNEELVFQRVLTPISSFYEFARKNSPNILSAHVNKKVTERNLEIARRENLGLPELTIDLGAFSRNTTTTSHSQGYTGGVTGNENLEVVATLNATWTIVGQNGLLNMRRLSRANLENRSATRLHKKAVDQNLYFITNSFQRLKTYEDQFEITQTKKVTAKTAYDITLEKYNRNKTTYLNFLQTISDYIEAEVSLKNLLNNHLKERVNLARYSGIDDLPDLLFEHMTKKEVTQTEYESFRNNNRTNGKTQKRTTKLQQSKNKGNQKEIIVDKIQRNSPEDLDDLDDLDDLEALEDLEIQE